MYRSSPDGHCEGAIVESRGEGKGGKGKQSKSKAKQKWSDYVIPSSRFDRLTSPLASFAGGTPPA